MIDRSKVDHNLSRGLEEDEKPSANSKVSTILKNKPFIILIACFVLFHLANGAMLPLAGQYMVSENEGKASVFISACIVIAQIVMVPVAIYAGKKAKFGRKRLLLIAFIALPIRGILYTFSANPYYVTGILVLDGLASGLFGVLAVLMVADLTKGSGHFNLAMGVLATAIGLGSAFSTLIAGEIAESYSISIAFLFLSGIAFLAMLLFWWKMEETKPENSVEKT